MNEELLKKKWKTAYRVAKLLQITPFLRMIGVNGSMATGNIKPESDIDFLVITKSGRIWTTRFLVTLLTHFTGKRRYDRKISGRICLNRYQTDKFLEILPHNEYHGQVFSSLVPIFDLEIYKDYQKANLWMEKFGYKVELGIKKIPIKNSILGNYLRNFGEWMLSSKFGDFVEKKLGDWQKKRIFKDIRTIKSPSGRIRISDRELCFHPPKEIVGVDKDF